MHIFKIKFQPSPQIREYFVFAKWQRMAISVLLPLIIISFFAPIVYGYFFGHQTQPASAEIMGFIAALRVKSTNEKVSNQSQTDFAPYLQVSETKTLANNHRLFAFNPNTATAATWRQLGLADKTILTIERYISKGGRFRKPSDLQKIYGLLGTDAQRLMPYVQIDGNNAAPNFEKSTLTPALSTQKFNSANKAISKIDINLADTSALIALPGIGSKLAARIVNFREKLGGFYSINQVGETYGVPDSTFQKIKPYLLVSANGFRQLNINNATAEQLRIPYIKYQIANAIILYRTQHGAFKTLEDLKKIILIDEANYQKILPYLTVN